MSDKTHWLQSPNKNYIGHWDLPEGKDLVLTIESAQWEEVLNPITMKEESKRVVRWKEDFKPLICNQTNAQSIIKATGISYMEDSKGCRVKLYVGKYNDKKTKQEIDCIRIRNVEQLSIDEVYDKLVDLHNKHKATMPPKWSEWIQQVIDMEHTLSYDKALNYLTKL